MFELLLNNSNSIIAQGMTERLGLVQEVEFELEVEHHGGCGFQSSELQRGVADATGCEDRACTEIRRIVNRFVGQLGRGRHFEACGPDTVDDHHHFMDKATKKITIQEFVSVMRTMVTDGLLANSYDIGLLNLSSTGFGEDGGLGLACSAHCG